MKQIRSKISVEEKKGRKEIGSTGRMRLTYESEREKKEKQRDRKKGRKGASKDIRK